MLRSILSSAIILALAFLLGCSSGNMSPADPPISDDGFNAKLPAMEPGHILWGVYDIYIDTDAMTVEAVLSHSGDKHYDVTDFVTPPECDDCLTIVLKTFDPITRIAVVEVSLRNPYPISGYDVRGILLLNDAGHDLVYPDGWVSIHDDGDLPYFNPFMRYGKDNEDGEFPGNTELMETYRVRIPMPPQYSAIRFAIDAWRPKNGSREPYQIWDKWIEGMLYSDGSNSVTFSCTVLDRNDDVLKVTIECSDLFDGAKEMSNIGGQWTVEFSNENLAGVSIEPYHITIEAYDSVVSFTLRDIHPIYVMEALVGWQPTLSMHEISDCTLDFAGLTGEFGIFGGYLADPMSNCAGFNSYDMEFQMPAFAVSLENLNPVNPSLQPYPPVRFDSTTGGGIAFSNSAEGSFLDGFFTVPLNQVVVTLDGDMFFHDDGLGDHQAHYPLYANTLGVVDICNGFEPRFYILWAETSGDHLPVFKGYEANFSTKAQVIGTMIPDEFIGSGPGKIANDASAILGIDVMEIEGIPPIENVELYILEETLAGAEIEVFNVYTDPLTKVSEVTHKMTIYISNADGEAFDLEILPINPGYEANPDTPSVAVLIGQDYEGFPGGYVNIYNTTDGALVDAIGSSSEASIHENAQFLDVIDGNFTICVTSATDEGGGIGGLMMMFRFTYI